MSVARRTQALLDLDEIAEYLGRSSPQAALRFLDAFDQTVTTLASMPEMGSPYETARPRLQGIRTWPVQGFKKHFIFYRHGAGQIEILRVILGTRDLDTTLEEGPI